MRLNRIVGLNYHSLNHGDYVCMFKLQILSARTSDSHFSRLYFNIQHHSFTRNQWTKEKVNINKNV